VTPIASRLGAVLLVLVASTLLGAQTPYRASSDLVPVYATVTDRDGLLVQNLPKERFTIRDNGKVQPIALFSNDIQPLTIVVMLDRSGSMSEHIGVVNDAAGHFVRALLPADKARVGAFGGEIVIRPDGFSSDQDELLQELAALRVKGGSPVWASIDHSITALRSELGRRVVLVLTDGHNRPGAGVFTTLDDVIHRAQYNDIMAYTIGFAVRPQPGQGPGGFGPPFRRGRHVRGEDRARGLNYTSPAGDEVKDQDYQGHDQ
jgi:VWFA-related protein